MIKRTLVALSGTPFTESAIRHAVEFACRDRGEVTGFTDVDLAKVANVGPVPMGAGAAAHDLVEHRLQLTEEHINEAIALFEKLCTEGNAKFRVVRESGDPFERFLDLWRYHDLTVLGLRGMFEYGIVHNPDDVVTQLVSRGVRPILAVAREYRPIKRILVAYSGSMESAKAIKQLVHFGLWPDATLKIATFGKGEEGDRLLADAAEYCRIHGVDPEVEHVEGSAKDGLLDHATAWNADLIAMGSSSRARFLKHILGDVVLHAVREAEIPLMLTQ